MVDARKFLTELEISYVWRDAKINLREYNPFMKRIFFCENESVLLGIILIEYYYLPNSFTVKGPGPQFTKTNGHWMGRRLLHTQAIEDTQPRLLSVLLLLYKRRGAGAEPLQLSVLHHQAKQPRSLSQSSLSDHLLPRCLAAADQAATAAPAASAGTYA